MQKAAGGYVLDIGTTIAANTKGRNSQNYFIVFHSHLSIRPFSLGIVELK